jgi:hypothetical protein
MIDALQASLTNRQTASCSDARETVSSLKKASINVKERRLSVLAALRYSLSYWAATSQPQFEWTL